MTTQLITRNPDLWEMVEKGEISKNSALYRFLNSDAGFVIQCDDVYWLELFAYCSITDKARAELKKVMAEKFSAQYLYDKAPLETLDKYHNVC